MASHILEAAKARWPGARYFAYDPMVPHGEYAQFGVEIAHDLPSAFTDATLVLIQNNHRVFAEMDLAGLVALMSPSAIVYDFWNLFWASEVPLAAGRHYVGLGTIAQAAAQGHAATSRNDGT
jgi:UDPglucose 6-dehydrogenase/UDP-N-acetyl-D-mannosaminuronic acid dehydrogenase